MTSPVNPAASAANPAGGFGPLREKAFLILWIATILGNVGSFVRDTASAWIVTEISGEPAAVALIQAAATLPIFLLAIPAGVLSDILDRRKLLIGIQLLLASVSITLMLLARADALSVSSLVALTFVGGIGTALMGPVWQSIVPELVPRAELKNAVALNSLGINISRSIGPAAGGLVLAAAGAAVTYLMDVTSYLFVIGALLWWKRPKDEADALSEQFLGAFRAGLRYARSSQTLHVVLFRAFVFFVLSSAVWALLPLVARNVLDGGPSFYGVLLAAVGVGAIGGALILPKLRSRFDPDGLVLLAATIAAIVMVSLSLAPPQWLAIVALLFLGAAWIMALTTLNGTAQAILPNWVRGRALAVYLTVFNGAMTIGSLGWGLVAQELGIATTLAIGAAFLFLVSLVLHRIKLPTGDSDLVPSSHWPEPLTAAEVPNDRGPVLVLIEYRVIQANRHHFLAAIHRLSGERRRDGAYGWGVTEDASDPEKIVEWFMVESWAEHLRQHRRVSNEDADVQRGLRKYHIGADDPVVRHFLTIPTNHRGHKAKAPALADAVDIGAA